MTRRINTDSSAMRDETRERNEEGWMAVAKCMLR